MRGLRGDPGRHCRAGTLAQTFSLFVIGQRGHLGVCKTTDDKKQILGHFHLEMRCCDTRPLTWDPGLTVYFLT